VLLLRNRRIEWLLFAVAAAIASYFVAPSATPIDRALPFVVVLISICGWAAGRWPAAMQTAALLLFIPPLFLTDEHTRLLAYGVIAAASFAFAVAIAPRSLAASIPLTVAGVLLLRWIPFSEVILWRELAILVGAIGVAACVSHAGGRGRPPLHSIAAALAVALFTPIFPARMLLFPVLFTGLLPVSAAAGAFFLITAFFVRYSIAVLCVAAGIAWMMLGRGRPAALHAPVYAVAIALFALWPWSGIVARAFPAFLFADPASERAQWVRIAIEHGQSVSLDVDPGSRTVVLTASAANASALPAGRAVGWAEVNGQRRVIRIGDIADFGFLRRVHFFASHNRPPRTPLDDIRDYGASAWLYAAGRIRISSPRPITSLSVTAAPDLPPGSKLQIEAVEFE
jgi:hypothetical protein